MLPESQEALQALAEQANDSLESAGQIGATHAFNLGCSMSLLPGAVLLVLAFFLTRGSWVATAAVSVLVLLAALGLASLAAATAKIKAQEQAYWLNVKPEIERTLQRLEISRPDFDQLACDSLPENAPLHRFAAIGVRKEYHGSETD